MRLLFPLVLFFLIAQLSFSQEAQSVKIQVQFDQLDGTISPIWNYFGYDEPNYTYAPNSTPRRYTCGFTTC
jgi:xylan 1,4-beta-xylosidase